MSEAEIIHDAEVMSVLISPTKATTIFRLPEQCACAYSPGFDLHISGMGETEGVAREQLVERIRELAAGLLARANEIEYAA